MSDPGYTLKVERMDAGRTYTADCSLFADSKGRPLDPERQRPRSFDIDCGDADGIPGGCKAVWPAAPGR